MRTDLAPALPSLFSAAAIGHRLSVQKPYVAGAKLLQWTFGERKIPERTLSGALSDRQNAAQI